MQRLNTFLFKTLLSAVGKARLLLQLRLQRRARDGIRGDAGQESQFSSEASQHQHYEGRRHRAAALFVFVAVLDEQCDEAEKNTRTRRKRAT